MWPSLLGSTLLVRGSSRRIETMVAGSGPIPGYQSDQSSRAGLDGFLVTSNQHEGKIHHEPPNRTCAVTSYQFLAFAATP